MSGDRFTYKLPHGDRFSNTETFVSGIGSREKIETKIMVILFINATWPCTEASHPSSFIWMHELCRCDVMRVTIIVNWRVLFVEISSVNLIY
jgi:hypothetical protein